jgi:hypothetical protein
MDPSKKVEQVVAKGLMLLPMCLTRCMHLIRRRRRYFADWDGAS